MPKDEWASARNRDAANRARQGLYDDQLRKPKRKKSRRAKRKAAKNICPLCNGQMVKRFRRADNEPFLGCLRYPDCRGTRPMPAQPAPKASGKPVIDHWEFGKPVYRSNP